MFSKKQRNTNIVVKWGEMKEENRGLVESETKPTIRADQGQRPLSLLVLGALKRPSQPLRTFIHVQFSQMVIKRI